MIVGFGSTEKAFEEAEREAFESFVRERFNALKLDYFTTEFQKEVEEWVEARAKAYQEQADQYKKADTFPDRYSSYWASVVSSGSHIVAILSFHHINRRHAWSPDGWALLQSKRVFHMDTWEARERPAA